MSSLFKAHSNWNSRPPDERFKTLTDLHRFCRAKRDRALQDIVNIRELDLDLAGDDIVLVGDDAVARMSNWAFKQFCARVGAPADYMTQLPAPVAIQNLKFHHNELSGHNPNRIAKLLFHRLDDGDMYVQAFNGQQYTRIWDYEVVERVMELGDGWKVPPAMKSTFSNKTVDASGLYASDHDCFIFMVNEENRIQDGSEGGLARGFFFSNSEVGAGCYDITYFLYRYVCGNHIVWGAENVNRVAVRHVGDAGTKAIEAFRRELLEYQEEPAKPIEAQIRRAKQFELGKSNEDVEDVVFGARILSRKTVREALALAPAFEAIDGSPWSAWGFAQSVTRLARAEQFAEKRLALDTAAGKVLNLVD